MEHFAVGFNRLCLVGCGHRGMRGHLLSQAIRGRSVEVAAAFFVATLSPVLGFIMLFTFRYTFVADHYQYLACIGPISLVSAGIVSLSDKFTQYRTVIVSASLLIVASLGMLTWRQAATYTDIETLWRTTLAKKPRNAGWLIPISD